MSTATITPAHPISRQRLYQLAHPERQRAYRLMHSAIKRGLLPRASSLACVNCGAPAQEYHHFDGYGDEGKYKVVPVCTPCHSPSIDAAYVTNMARPVTFPLFDLVLRRKRNRLLAQLHKAEQRYLIAAGQLKRLEREYTERSKRLQRMAVKIATQKDRVAQRGSITASCRQEVDLEYIRQGLEQTKSGY